MDLRLFYTHSGDLGQGDTIELSLASEIPLDQRFYGIVEIVNTFSLTGKERTHIEGTIGLGWRKSFAGSDGRKVATRRKTPWNLFHGKTCKDA